MERLYLQVLYQIERGGSVVRVCSLIILDGGCCNRIGRKKTRQRMTLKISACTSSKWKVFKRGQEIVLFTVELRYVVMFLSNRTTFWWVFVLEWFCQIVTLWTKIGCLIGSFCNIIYKKRVTCIYLKNFSFLQRIFLTHNLVGNEGEFLTHNLVG